MRGLTLTAPWGSLVARGEKRIETRPHGTRYRGPLAIHQAKGLRGLLQPGERLSDSELEDRLELLCHKDPFRRALTGGLILPELGQAQPRAKIVAVCELHDVLTAVDAIEAIADGTVDAAVHELRFGNYTRGRFAWLLRDVRRLPEPVECRGMQGLWPVPPNVRDRIAAQL
jgi:activating signal cointegrator 1